MAARVMIPVSPDRLKPRAALFEGLLDADGLGIDAVDEDPVKDEGVAPVALDYRDLVSVTGEKPRGRRIKRTLKASNVLSAVGLTARTMPALQWLGRSISGPLRQENIKYVYSRSLFAIEPQRRASVVDGEAPLRDHRCVGGNWLVV